MVIKRPILDQNYAKTVKAIVSKYGYPVTAFPLNYEMDDIESMLYTSETQTLIWNLKNPNPTGHKLELYTDKNRNGAHVTITTVEDV